MSHKPRVCFLTGTLGEIGGAERMTAVIANDLVTRGYEVFIVSLWGKTSCFQLHPAVRHHTLHARRPSFKQAFLSTIVRIRRFLRDNTIDTLVDVDTMLSLFTLPATLGLNVRRIAWEHCHLGEDLGRPQRRLARMLAARFSESIVVLTERDRQQWLVDMAPRARVIAIGNPLPFPYPIDPAPRSSNTVLAVGRLTAAKGFAWKLVSAEAPDWKLVIAGDGEERSALEEIITMLNLQDCVTLVGMRQDIENVYRNASIFCLSSHYEGFALVLLEAMAFGLPIVSTDCETGPTELIRNGENGMLVRAGDPRALADGLIEVIRDNNLANALASSARDVARRYTLDGIAKCWEQLLAPAPDAVCNTH